MPPALARETKTVETMIGLYCAGKHGRGRGAPLCDDCAALLGYVRERLAKCPYGLPNREKPQGAGEGELPKRPQGKPSCSKCTIHCYREPERTTIRKVIIGEGMSIARYDLSYREKGWEWKVTDT